MKFSILYFVLSAVIVLSCNKEGKKDSPEPPASTEAAVSFYHGDTLWQADSVVTARYGSAYGANTLYIVAYQKGTGERCELIIPVQRNEEKSFNVLDMYSSTAFVRVKPTLWFNSIGSGSLVVTSYKNSVISGTFSGTIYPRNPWTFTVDNSNPIQLTNGKFQNIVVP